MKDRKELQSRLDTLVAQHRYLMKGRVVPSPQAQSLQRKILDLKDEIKSIEREEAERINLAKAPVDEVLEVIAIPLVADVLYDLVIGVDSMLRRNGCRETVFADYAASIRHNAHALVNTLSNADAGLPLILEADDTMVDAVKKKVQGFIKQRLKMTK